MTVAVPTTELVWTFPGKREPAFVVHHQGQPSGWLRFEREPAAPSPAEWRGQGWTFEHAGRYPAPITIRRAGSAEVAGLFTPWMTGGGIVELSSGARYCWNRKHLFSRTWCFRSQQKDQAAVCVTQETGPLVSGGIVTLCPGAAKSPDMPVLVLLAWYLRILEFEGLSEALFVCA